MPIAETGVVKQIIETLLKPFSAIANPIAERIGEKFKRKPKLYFNIYPVTSVWCYAWNGYGKEAKPIMQIRFDADITNDGNERVLILDGYAKGTKAKLPFVRQIEIPPTSTVSRQVIAVFVEPIIGEGGKDFTGKLVFVDQLKRKHYTDKTTFTWVGSTEPPTAPTLTNRS
jgi:hypothetical protein